jgi:hypothetical protein
VRRVFFVAIGIAVAGAVAGVLLGTGHGVMWAVVGAALAAATSLAATMLWESRRDRASSDTRPTGGSGRIRVRQRVGAIRNSGRVIGVQAPAPSRQVEVRQDIDTAGPGSTIIGFDGDAGRSL